MYTKKEENGENRVLKCDLDGSNKTEIAVFYVEKINGHFLCVWEMELS